MEESQQPNTVEQAEAKLTELKAQLKAAFIADDGEFAEKLLNEIADHAPALKATRKAREKVEWEAKSKERELAREKLEKAFVAVYEKQAEAIQELVGFDNVDIYFKLNPAAATKSCGITKAKIDKKPAGDGGGTWERKDSRSTDMMRETHAEHVIADGELGKGEKAKAMVGMTIAAAWEAYPDKNARYALRKLLITM